ncbi:MAG: RrF2 family transcriptional regulator [Victivallaceae bacterium]
MSSILKVSEAVALAIHACVVVAKEAENKTTTASIASVLKASEAHLSKVMQRLVKAGIVSSVRGPGGGFVMNARPEDIKLVNIYEAVDGVFRCSECLFDHQACDGKKCVLGSFIENLNKQVKTFFETKTLDNLMKGK